MSLARQFLREFRPLFRLLEEPFSTPAAFGAALPRRFDPFNNDFTQFQNVIRPAIDVVEDGNTYVVEAELPGVKKENVEVRVGDEGRSLTIEGRVFTKSPDTPKTIEAPTETQNSVSSSDAALTETNKTATQLTSERAFTGTSSFTRSIWLPRPVDGSNVTAKLQDGILTVRIPKAQERGSVTINVE